MSSSGSSLKIDFGNIRNVLVRAANWVGDAVMTLPALAAIRSGIPQARLSVLTKPWVANVYECSSMVDRIISYESPGRHEGIRGKWRLGQELKREGFDLAILFQNAFEAALIAFIAGIPHRAGYNTDARGILLTHGVSVNGAVKRGHQVTYYREMVKGLGLEAFSSLPSLSVSREQEEETERKLESLGIGSKEKLVGFGPGAAYGPAKQWFPERFALLADRISLNWKAKVLVFGSRGDRPVAAAVMQSAQLPVIDLTGQTTLRQAMALLARCSLFVTNDSGLMHVAAALGIPVLAIFGSTNPVRTGPLGKSCRVIWKAVPCAPCFKTHCPEKRECMEQITVEEVYEEARNLFNPRGG